MKIVHIETQKRVKKTKQELEKEYGNNWQEKLFVSEYKYIPTNKPTYIVEMTAEELQLVSFYLELENRKPIMNIELDTKITKENNND